MRVLWSSRLVPGVVGGVLLLAAAAGRSAEEPDATFEVRGLSKPARIVVDHWGVPHIYAATHYDAFFVQGFNAARDRLWQLDLWRRRGLGTLSEVLGPGYLQQDRAARLFLYRGDMYAEWLAYGSDAKRIAEAFTSGINAYVDLLESRPDLVPPEFTLLGYRPARWQPDDVVRIRSNGLWRNVANEVKRARIVCRSGLPAATLWKVLEPEWQTRVPDGLDPCVIPDNVLDTYLLATAPVVFAGSAADDLTARTVAAGRRQVEAADVGSNNWVVAPSRSATGRPILANDPHRAHAVPSLRYIVHLVAPGLDVIGAGEPALPGVSIGHNQRIAFGLTIFPIDQEDLYVYRLTEGGGYLYGGRGEPVTVIRDQIPVRGGQAVPVTFAFTRHGPVVHQTETHLFAVRAAWLQPGMSPYFGSVEYMRAGNWREFRAALNRWGAPSENQVYADVDGNIGYKPAGLFPRRESWDGLLPVPGDGRYEWAGYFDMDALPEEFNPARGFTGSANSMNLPAGYPIAERRIGFEWTAPWRYRRLWEVLTGQQQHDLVDSHALQRDYQSVLAREVLARLPEMPLLAEVGDPAAAEALKMLQDWDATLSPESGAAALYAVWYHRHLEPALTRALAPEAADVIERLDSLAVLESLGYPVGQSVAADTLGPAYEETAALLGSDPARWRWGDLHRIRFEHPLEHRAPARLRSLMAYPTYGRGGSANTVNNTAFEPDDFLVDSGASFRMVLDVGRWDDAEMTNAPGQSGLPASPFYDNLLQGWAEDSSFPLLYSKTAVEANAALEIALEPAPYGGALP